jgi:hypothetical protein
MTTMTQRAADASGKAAALHRPPGRSPDRQRSRSRSPGPSFLRSNDFNPYHLLIFLYFFLSI